MGKWKEGWHPTSRVKWPKERLYINFTQHDMAFVERRFHINDIIRPGYKTAQNEFSISMYCYFLENRADTKTEERRLQEKYERLIHS